MRFLIIFTIICSTVFAQNYYDAFLQGNYLEGIKDYPAAIQAYEKAIQFEPGFAPAYNALGFVYLEMKDLSQARHYFQKHWTSIVNMRWLC